MLNKINLLIGYYEETLSEKEKKLLRKKINTSEKFRDEFYELGNLLRSNKMNQCEKLTDEEINRLYEKVMLKINEQSILSKLIQFIITISGLISQCLKTIHFKGMNNNYAYAEIKLRNPDLNLSKIRNSDASYEKNILILHKFNSFISKLSF